MAKNYAKFKGWCGYCGKMTIQTQETEIDSKKRFHEQFICDECGRFLYGASAAYNITNGYLEKLKSEGKLNYGQFKR